MRIYWQSSDSWDSSSAESSLNLSERSLLPCLCLALLIAPIPFVSFHIQYLMQFCFLTNICETIESLLLIKCKSDSNLLYFRINRMIERRLRALSRNWASPSFSLSHCSSFFSSNFIFYEIVILLIYSNRVEQRAMEVAVIDSGSWTTRVGIAGEENPLTYRSITGPFPPPIIDFHWSHFITAYDSYT